MFLSYNNHSITFSLWLVHFMIFVLTACLAIKMLFSWDKITSFDLFKVYYHHPFCQQEKETAYVVYIVTQLCIEMICVFEDHYPTLAKFKKRMYKQYFINFDLWHINLHIFYCFSSQYKHKQLLLCGIFPEI